MAESDATTQFRELQKSFMEASSKLKQVRQRAALRGVGALRTRWRSVRLLPRAALAGTPALGERGLGRHRPPDAPAAQVAVQGRSREQERQRCVLTLAELDPLPDDATTFKGLGRACAPAAPPRAARVCRARLMRLSHFAQLCAAGQAGAGGGAARGRVHLRRGAAEAEGARSALCGHRATLRCAHALVRPQTSKEYLEGQAMEIEKNIKELLKTNEALARQIMAQ
jgi:hypothetical protein